MSGVVVVLFTTPTKSLFHVVVDTDETVARILDVLSREKSGRVTFMPLNRLDPQPVDYPKAKDALPMVKKLQFDERYKRAFDQVFGKTVICPNLETASGYAKSHGLNAITLDGDKAERKGALTGGYHDARRSRLETIAALKQCTDKLDAEQLKSDTVKRDLAATENQLTKVHSDLQLVDATRRRQQSNHDLLAKELAGMSRELVVIRDSLSAAKKRQQSSQANLLSLSTQHDGIQAELNSPLTATLSDAEVRELDKLERDIVKAEAAFGKLTADRAAVEMELKKIEMELEMNLKRRREDLVSKLAQADSGEGVDPVADTPETSEEELKSIQVSLKALSKKSAGMHGAEIRL